ncbi:MAG: asparagine synthase (glutamine-hydrolyzing) [Nanoarchaeota archaeon]|nr:asparagine synthase (glutamine-hydrolyzing) [Nanoarchaeota archaeon]
MCAIAGFSWDDAKLIKSMVAIQKHRGPDQDNVYTDKQVSLGHARLSIIDLSDAGKQPMSHEALTITFNGEIYNFKKIREDLREKGHKFNSETDTEVILHAYQEYGEKCVEKFNGMFAFAIYNATKKEFFLARDRAGVKPLYYSIKEKKLVFASELKAILLHDHITKDLSKTAFHQFLTFRYTPDEQTLFEDIQKLPPGHHAIYKSGKLTIKEFWNLNITPKKENSYASKIDDTLKESVRKRLMSDVPLGVFLSGGLDSTYIVSHMKELMTEPIKTFSVGFEQGQGYDESTFARIASETYDTDHHEIFVKEKSFELLPKILWHMDEPIADFASIPTYILSEFAKKKVSVVLTGEGADELFAGYRKYKYLNAFNTYKTLTPLPIRKALSLAAAPFTSSPAAKRFLELNKSATPTEYYLNLISYFNKTEKQELMLHPEQKGHSAALVTPYLKKRPLTDALTTLDFKTWLPEDLLMKVDKTTMAFGLEARVPFLDPDMIKLASQIPANLKLRHNKEKYILRKAMQARVPKSIYKRKKHGFNVPVHEWLDNDLKSTAQELLSPKSIAKRGLIKSSYVEKLFNTYKTSKIYSSRQLWSLLNFEVWARIYLDNDAKKPKGFDSIL